MPQIEDLMKKTNQYIQFEIEVAQWPMMAFSGGNKGASASKQQAPATDSNGGYKEATEEDIEELMRFLGGM